MRQLLLEDGDGVRVGIRGRHSSVRFMSMLHRSTLRCYQRVKSCQSFQKKRYLLHDWRHARKGPCASSPSVDSSKLFTRNLTRRKLKSGEDCAHSGFDTNRHGVAHLCRDSAIAALRGAHGASSLLCDGVATGVRGSAPGRVEQ